MKSKRQNQRERQLRVRVERRDPPDLKKLASALIALAEAKAEADAEAEETARRAQQGDESGSAA